MNKDRGMMKWEPYRSLNEQSSFLSKMLYEKNKIQKPQMAKEKAEEINEILCHYSGEEVTATYFDDGYLYSLTGTILKIDAVYRFLTIDEKRIAFRSLTDLVRA